MARFIFSTSNSTGNAYGGVYATDGTAAGTVDIGEYQSYPYASEIAGAGPVLYDRSFYLEQDYAGDGVSFINLMSTDGTKSGTKSVLTLESTANPIPVGAWDVNGTLIAAGAVAGLVGGVQATPGLLVSKDGTNFSPITSGVTAADIVTSNGLGYFNAVGADGGALGLWRTDGTTAGTYGIDPAGVVLNPVNFESAGNKLTVFANGGANGANSTLWVTNGSAGSTRPIQNAALGNNIQTDVGTASAGGKAIFAAIDAAGDYSVWATNGTSAGTVEIFNGGTAFAATRPVLGVAGWGNNVVITSGYGLFVTDTTGSGVVNDINPWPQYGPTPPSGYVLLGDKLILASPNVNYNGVQEPISLYVSDGTSAGTVALNVAGLQSASGAFTVVGNQVVFAGTDVSGKEAFFMTDGTAAGSHELTLPAAVPLDATHLPVIEALPAPGSNNTGVVTLGGGSQSYTALGGVSVQAGSGNDTITAAAGNVTVTGSSGHLTFFGGVAPSAVTGGSGSATIFGGAGGGVFVGGGAGHNVMISQGAAGATTTMIGMGANDQIFGSAAGDDILNGGSGRDTILGGGGSTVINGGAAGSVIFTSGAATVNGGTGGRDTIVGGSHSLGVTAQNGDAVFGGGGALTVAASLKGADSIVGGSGALAVAGRGANMLVVGGSSTSNISTGNGASLVFAGSGNLSLVGGAGSMQVEAGSGVATIIEGAGRTTLQVARGQAGGTDVLSGFRPGTDAVDLFGYTASQQTVSSAMGSTVVSLVDGTRITLLGVANPGHSIIG